MKEIEKVELRERILKIELSSAGLGLIASLIFVFSRHISEFFQLYYPIVVFCIHQSIAFVLYATKLLTPSFNVEQARWKVFWCLALVAGLYYVFGQFIFIDLGEIYFFTSQVGKNVFISLVIYCVVYTVLFIFKARKYYSQNGIQSNRNE